MRHSLAGDLILPQIGPDLWKVALSFFWWRQYEDGRIEQEFDPETGQIRLWGTTPKNLKRAGWLPVTPDLANKMREHNEFGIPTQSPSVIIELKPGDELEIFKDCSVLDGYRVHCKVCGAVYRTFGERAEHCLNCGTKPAWRCPKCSKLTDNEICPDCNLAGQIINPLTRTPDKWEEVVYILGIKGLYRLKFNSQYMVAEH